jgi:hypothetical protein
LNISPLQVRLFTTKVYSRNTYFSMKSPPDDQMVLELTSQIINHSDDETVGSLSRVKVTPIEYAGVLPLKHKSLITKLDNAGQLSITILNSIHMFYCQALFSNFETSISVSVKLLHFVTPEESPAFDSSRTEGKGKSTMLIDDVAWTKNDCFVVILFSTCTIAILPRLGNALVAFYNPTLQNISTKQVDFCQHYRAPRCFNELVVPQTIH